MSSRLQQEGGAFDGGGGDGGGGDGGGGDGEAEGAFDGGGGDGGSGDADAESEGGGEAAGAHGAECEDDLVDSSKEEEEEFEEPKDEWSDGLLQYAAAIQKGNLLREPPPKRQRVDDLPGPNSSEDNVSSCLLQCWRIRHCGFRCTNQASKACTTALCRKHCLKQNVRCLHCLGKVQVPRFERVRRPGPNYRP